jgi:hypothetical protein
LSRLSLKENNVDLSFYEHCMSVFRLTLLIIYTRRTLDVIEDERQQHLHRAEAQVWLLG